MPRIPIKVGAREFASKAALKENVREIMARYTIAEYLNESDFAFIRELLDLHPERDQKVGVGIASFQVILDPEWKRNRQLVLHRIDGTATDFSWVSCIDGKNRRRDIREALRRAVVEQVLDFRSGELTRGAVCPYRGTPLTERNCHVDHVAPDTFEAILARFLLSQSIELEQVEITPSRDNQLFSELVDREFEARWRSFHKAHARLRLLSSGGNLSEARRRW
jgi:Protein of unknown function (DUF3223)